jgi:hypothetical protein
MRSISAKQFKEFVNDDPAWANKLKGPVEIRTYANMDNSGITHLSPFLLFSGRDNEGNVASFKGCSKLKKAEGNFDGFVDFGVNYDEIELNLEAQGGNQDNIDILDDNAQEPDNTEEPNEPQNTRSNQNTPQNEEREDLIDIPYACPVGIKEIGDFKILRPNNKGDAVDFSGAIELKVYRGSYPGHINIGHNDLLRWTREMSGGAEREKIRFENLEVTGENNKGLACTINNSLVNRLEGHYSSAVRLVGTEVGTFGTPRLNPQKKEIGELDITPNLAGTKIELKNNSYPSTIKVIGFAKEFPFEAHELDLPRASTKKDGDPLTELRDMLKIKKAMLTKEDPKNSKDPWHKQIKRTAVRTIAQCLQADDILKKEGHLASSKNRLSKILKASAVIATIIASFSYNTLQEIGKEIKENVIIEPTAAQLQDYAYSKGLSKDIIKKLPVTAPLREVARGSKENNENNETNQPKDKEAAPLEIIINKEGKTIQLSSTSIDSSKCQSKNDCCHLQPISTSTDPKNKKTKNDKKMKYFGDNNMGLASL